MRKNIKKEEAKPVVINQIIIRPVDRASKDIASWRIAHQHAEQVVYANRVRLYDVYEDVILDGHLTGITQKRIEAILNKTLRFEKNGKREDAMNDVIESEVFRNIIKKIMESVFWGISGLEFIPGEELHFAEVPRKHIRPTLNVIAKEQYSDEGFDYAVMPNIWVIGDKNDLGLLLKCAPYAIWKKGDMADWAQYIEIFGQPVRVMKYDAYDQQTKIELQYVLDNSGSSLALMIPKQAEFDLKDGKQSNGDGKLQESFKNACNDEMSVIVLTNTETTTSSSSSGYAQAKEHGKQQLEVTKSDLKFVANCLNSKHFLNILKTYGLPVEGGRFIFEKEIDLEALKARKEIDAFVSGKVPVSDDYYYETYGIPKPDNYDELRARMDEEREAKLNPPVPAPPPPSKPKDKKKKPAPENQSDPGLGFWDKFRATLSDFFDPAHKD